MRYVGQGWGQGQDRAGWAVGTCVFLHKNVHKNRLECLFGAVCSKKTVFFTWFFSGGTGIFPLHTGIFQRGKNPAKSRGKIRYHHTPINTSLLIVSFLPQFEFDHSARWSSWVSPIWWCAAPDSPKDHAPELQQQTHAGSSHIGVWEKEPPAPRSIIRTKFLL